VVFARGNGPDPAEIPGHNGLPHIVALRIGILAPGDDGAIGPQRQVVIAARRDGNDTPQVGRHGGLSPRVVTPGDHGSVSAQGQRMPEPGRDGDHVGKAGRRI